jgi:hypothetical protein
VAVLEAFVDAPLSHKGLTIFPIIAPHGSMLPYLLSTETDGQEVLTIRERDDSEPPMLLAKNNSLNPLLVLGGEPLPGEHPGRLVARSFLLGGKSVTQLPASAVERGGWVTPEQENQITDWVNRYPLVDHQIGILACLGPRILGLEALGAHNLYRPVHRRLLIRFIKRGLSHTGPEEVEVPQLTEKAQDLVASLEEAERTETNRIGMGEFRCLGGSLAGGELFNEGHLVHLSATPVDTGSSFRAGQER